LRDIETVETELRYDFVPPVLGELHGTEDSSCSEKQSESVTPEITPVFTHVETQNVTIFEFP
jgi:hypothetical protein